MTHDSPSLSVLVCDGLAEPGLALLRREAEVLLDDLTALGRVDAWIVRSRSQVDAAALRSAAPRLRVVGRAGVGVDNIDLEEALPPGAPGAEQASREALLARSDYVSLHLPLTTETRGVFGRSAMAGMKPGARLVCAARGGLIDEQALHHALDEGRLAGAALDVFAQEPPRDLTLLHHPRLVATPHLGAQTVEAQARVAIEIANNVLAALRGETPRGRLARPEPG